MIRAREDRWFERFRRTGQPRLLAKVFDRTAPELWRVAAHLCRDRHAAEDAVQGTFLAAIEAKDDWDMARPLLPWLLGMLANRVREHRRRTARVPDAERVNVPGTRDPADLAEGHEFGAAFREALARIDEPYRSALERNLVHGLAAHEIASELGVPAGTVRMRLHRGLEQLRQKLPKGFVAGSAVAMVMAPDAFAAMRQVVLGKVPGGAATAVVGTGHVVTGVIGAVLMKKMILAAAVLGLVAFGTWSLWGQGSDVAAGESPGAAMVAETNTRPLEPRDSAATRGKVTDASERSAVSPAVAAPSRGQLRLVLRHGGNKRPLADIAIQVLAGMAKDPRTEPPGVTSTAVAVSATFEGVHAGVTDTTGSVTFELPPGFAEVTFLTLPQHEHVFAKIEPGVLRELPIDLPVTLAVDIEVVDADGRPVADAQLLGQANVYLGARRQSELGRTGADGHWRESFVEPSLMVRAVAPGHAASMAELIETRRRASAAGLFERSAQTATLRLGDRPATLVGTVLGEDGQPVANAQLAIKPESNTTVLPLFLQADEHGRYECAYVPPGPCTVFAWFAVGKHQNRFAKAEGIAIVDDRTVIDLRFLRGARVIARVQRPNGRPWINASVAALPEMRIGMGVDVGRQGRTDERGECTIEHLLPGPWGLSVHAENDSLQEKVELAEGQDHEFGGRLGGTAWIEVQAVDEMREPLAGWTVQLHTTGDDRVWTVQEALTDTAGVARFDRLPVRPFRASLHKAASLLSSLTQEVQPNVRAQLVVPRNQMPDAIVRGTFVLPDGVAVNELQCSLMRASIWETKRPNPDDQVRGTIDPTGRFVFAGLPTGVYHLGVLRTGGRPRGILGMRMGIEVSAAADVDLGNITLGMSTLRVRVARTDGVRARGLTVGFAIGESDRFGSLPQTAEDGVVELPSVPAGNHRALVWGENIAPVMTPVTVAIGQVTEVPIVAVAATPTTFRFVDVPLSAAVAKLTVHRGTATIASEVVTNPAAPCVRGLPPGNYRVEVTSGVNETPSHGTTEFTVGAAPGEPVEVRLGR